MRQVLMGRSLADYHSRYALYKPGPLVSAAQAPITTARRSW